MFEYSEKKIKELMDKSINVFQEDLKGVRAGRVSPEILDVVSVEVYGGRSSIKSLGKIDVIDNQTLNLYIFDQTIVTDVEKSIQNSSLGVNPIKDGSNIKIIFPKPNETTRNNLIKTINAKSEEVKISIRNHRRKFKDEIEEAKKNKEISEDDFKRFLNDLQKITDNFISKVKEIAEKKNKEIVQI